MPTLSSRHFGSVLLSAAAVSAVVSVSLAEETASKDAKIARAMQAGPPEISQEATVVDFDGTVLREGSNGWTCLPGVVPGDDHPMCNDAVWMKLMQAVGAKADFQTDRVGISYMLQGDINTNNADPYDTEPNEGEVWVQEGPHLMVIVPDPAMLEGIPDDPNAGGPYVMWKGTPYAHIMVPTAASTE